jgi:hypothetical protein
MRKVELLSMEDIPTAPLKKVRRNKRWTKKRIVLIVVLLFLFLAISSSALVGLLAYNTYHRDLSHAQAGMQRMRSAVTLLESLLESLPAQPLSPQTVERAQQEFAGALSNAQSIEASLTNLSGIASLAPIYGPRLIAAIHLSRLAVDVSQAGIDGCKMLEIVLTRLGSPLYRSKPGLTSADFITLSKDYQTVKASLNAAMNEAMLLKAGDVSFDARLTKLLEKFRANIPNIRAALAEADQVIAVLPTLLGISAPAHYLLEIMDSTELRPGGGFIGNYGIASFSGGRLTPTHITDTYLLDRPFESAGRTIPYPPAYQWFAQSLSLSSWSLRDSNLDADFPTDARNGELNYQREGGKVPLQGVIAITPYFIENVLNITGPIAVPEYHETVTARNLVNLIHFYQLGEGGSSSIPSTNGQTSQRKYFTELLGEHLLARVQQLPSTAVAKFLQLMFSSLRTKDIQVYFNASSAENALGLLHLDATIQSPPGDHLFIVDANVAANKANGSIVNTVHDQVTLDERGNTVHRTSITYAWKLTGQNYGNQLYQDYTRIYVPRGSTLFKQSGWQPLGTSIAFGSQVWAGFFTLVQGQTRTITLIWTSHDVAKHEANGWHYRFLLQRQAGVQWMLDLRVTLPSCAAVTSKLGGLVISKKQEAILKRSLTQDLHLGVDYVCK